MKTALRDRTTTRQYADQVEATFGCVFPNTSGIPRATQALNDILDRFGEDSEWGRDTRSEISRHLFEVWGYADRWEQWGEGRPRIPINFQTLAGLRTRLSREHRIRTAKRIGLRYLAAAKYGHTDLKAYKVWQDMTATDDKPQGAYDGCGVWGASPRQIEAAWYAAGCRNSEKFSAILAGYRAISTKDGRYDNINVPLRKSHSASQVRNVMRGYMFCQRRKLWVRSPKHLEILGRVSLPLRYAMLRNYAETKQLDFVFAAEVQHWTKAQKAALLSPKEAWYFLYGRCPFVKDAPRPEPLAAWNKAAGSFARLVNEFGKDESGTVLPDMAHPIFNLCAVFGSEGEVRRFVKDWSAKGIHDAGQFALPRNAWTPPAWAGFCRKFPEALRYAQQFGNVETTGIMPKSLAELRDIAGRFVYDNSFGVEELSTLCNSFGLDQSSFEAYKRLTATEKPAESCPGVELLLGEYRFFKLAHNDVRGPLLGLFTDCCQHLDGAGASCARHGWQDTTSAFYAVEYKGHIIAQSWAWRSKKGDLVFDSVEGLGGYDYNAVAGLFAAAAERIVGRLGIARVLVGHTNYGITTKVREYLREQGRACDNGLSEEPRSACSYMDGRSQWLLYQSGEPSKFRKSEVAHVEATTGARNELQPGSEVLCEHCDAEVHPDCEICPACGENIAAWV